MLQPQPPELKSSSRLSLRSSANHRQAPPLLAFFLFFLVEMGSHSAARAIFELLGPSDPSASVSQSAGITSVSRRARLIFFLNLYPSSSSPLALLYVFVSPCSNSVFVSASLILSLHFSAFFLPSPCLFPFTPTPLLLQFCGPSYLISLCPLLRALL